MLSHFNKTTRDSSKAQNEYVMLKIVTAGALPLVKCPCCRKVPRNGVMLQCIEGHNVCEACRNTNPNPAICWKCGHRLNEPPTRNYTVENIIEAFPFEWPCNQADAGCNFTGERHALEVHEKTCNQHARFKCPHYNCNSTVLLGTVMEHFGTVHSNFTNFTKRYIGHGSKTGTSNIFRIPIQKRCSSVLKNWNELGNGSLIWLFSISLKKQCRHCFNR